jgi:DNA-binding GntR family transcriptional regulator
LQFPIKIWYDFYERSKSQVVLQLADKSIEMEGFMQRNRIIVAVPKQNVGEVVFDQMKKAIMDGKWKPGKKLPSENELSRLMGSAGSPCGRPFRSLPAWGS